ncbi:MULTISPECIES: hypothetical protein [unclassified Caulobacter]|jgi:hypothetical protein|uniref:hypothetical protein n=1 Tax=unclassified Caulobacter TaxID=2648921 RepID=UPI0006FD77E5|nr:MULTISPECIES: hypothetical protein [unclassified Caulobacter]KQV56501.1 hypothetical protein ASC62_09210 [Caulobacter sp. Root342]KQV72136.1 hypothetical protein ASC70_00160 [Caulobacter sp. Root343]
MSVRPVDAALEGLRTMRRKPLPVLAWATFSLVMLPILGLIAKIVLGEEGRAALNGRGSSADPREILDLVTHLGGVMVLLIALALVLGSVLQAAIIRSVIEPKNDRFAYLRLGKEELQLLVVSLITWAAALGVTVIPSGAVVLGAALLSGAAAGWFATLGGLAVIGLSLWVAVRLSLLGPHAFSHHHIDIRAAWIQTHGQFFRLLGMFALTLILSALVSIVGATLSSIVGNVVGGGVQSTDGGVVASHPRLILTLLANLLLAPIFLTLQTVILVAAPAKAFAHLNQDEIDAGLHA